MANRLLHFTFFMSLMLIFGTNIQAQKFINKGDLKPIIDNVFIWHLTQTAADIDRSNGAAGIGTFEGNNISGAETTEGNSDVAGNEDTQDDTEENNDTTDTGDENDNTGVSINPGGLITENTLPSRGGNEDDGITGTETDDDTTDNTDAIEVGKPNTLLEEIITYPNPASERINVLIPLMDELVRVRLINLAGQPVLDRTAYGNSRMILETYHLPEGVYLLEFTGDTKQIFRRTYIKR